MKFHPDNDAYNHLGVLPSASAAEIRAAYLERIRERRQQLEEIKEDMARDKRAYETLSDPVRRATHDRGRAAYQKSLQQRRAKKQGLMAEIGSSADWVPGVACLLLVVGVIFLARAA